MSLVITIILLTILATISLNAGINSIKNSNFTKFRTDLEIMQAQVNLLSEKYKEDIETAQKEGNQFTKVGKDIPSELFTEDGGIEQFLAAVKNVDSSISIESTDYRYFDKEELGTLGIEYADIEYLVDFQKRKVIAIEGMEYEGTIYYTLNQIVQTPTIGGLQREKVTVDNVKYTEKGKKYLITLENIQCSKYVSKYDVKYRKVGDTEYKVAGKAISGENYSFEVRKAGEYEILVIDAAEQTSEGLTIKIKSNQIVADDLGIMPKINTEEMTPVKYDTATGEWVEADTTVKGDWFDYSTTAKKWANVETENGYFVYIPRFAYKITSGYHQALDTAGTMAVVFLNADNTLKTDTDSEGNPVSESDLIHASEVTSSVDETSNEVKTGKNATTNYIIHPAFEAFDTAEKKVDGLWVAKYEMSMEQTSDGGTTWEAVTTSDGTIGDILTTTDTTKRMVSKPRVRSWRNIQVTNIYNNCYNMNREIDSHMMKNTEWGAVSYLTVSQYGKGATSEVMQNGSVILLTGMGGSTTGNEYGIFDMSGGAWEYVAGYVYDKSMQKSETVIGSNYNYNKNLIEETDSKYKDIYSVGTTESKTDCYIANNLKVGDGIWEVTSNTGSIYGWYGDYCMYAGLHNPYNHSVFVRGGDVWTTDTAGGVFATQANLGKGYDASFRTVCVVQ